MLLVGMGRAMTYAASLRYGLSDPARRSRNMGVHEMLIGVSCAVGPLLGGIAAKYSSLRFSFQLACYWIAASIACLLILHAILSRNAGRRQRADGAGLVESEGALAGD